MQKVHALAGMSGLERHEITLRHHEFWVYDSEGHQRSVHCTLEEREHNHRMLNPLPLKSRPVIDGDNVQKQTKQCGKRESRY